MDRREFIKKCYLGAGGLALYNANLYGSRAKSGSRYRNNKTHKQYNVLFVLVDQWRFCALSHGANHDKLVRTPNLDAFARQSAEWTRCYAAHPLCTPNRSSIITGRWPWQTGMNTNNLMLPPTEKCIAQEFTSRGYKSHYIGKWHMDGVQKPGFVPQGWRRRGFTTFEGFNRGHLYFNSHTFTNDGHLMTGWKGHYEPTMQADLAIKFMKENKNHPFFCFVSWGPPHTPYKLHPAKYSYNPRDVVVRPNVPSNRKRAAQRTLADYFAHCTALDHEFGRLMKALDQMQLTDNTLVVFTADHGDMHRSHNLMYKQHPQEESWHVPLMMRLPGKIKASTKINNLVSSADLMPTILSLCGIKVPDSCSGKDKSPAMLRPNGMPDESIYGGVRDKWRGVVKGDYKLVTEITNGKEQATMLYNLKNDPYELKNLIDNKKLSAVKADLLAEMANWKKKTNDYFPGPPKDAQKFYNA